jgi:hypothetical protein
MRRLPTIVLFCIALAAVATLQSVSADSSSMSSGSSIPKNHQYLLGNWTCTVNLAAMEGQPAMTDHAAMTISMAPSMTLHSHVAAKDYMSDTYEGYDMKTKTHWLNTADTVGDVTVETSMDGTVFTGTTWAGGTATPTRDTQTKVSDAKIRDITETKEKGKWTTLADAVCTKM